MSNNSVCVCIILPYACLFSSCFGSSSLLVRLIISFAQQNQKREFLFLLHLPTQLPPSIAAHKGACAAASFPKFSFLDLLSVSDPFYALSLPRIKNQTYSLASCLCLLRFNISFPRCRLTTLLVQQPSLSVCPSAAAVSLPPLTDPAQ